MVKEAVLSPSKQRREEEKLATREKILEAARDMFSEVGVEATTMRAIADRIGYTATAIYYHFKDKDALLLELCHRDFSQLGHLIAQAGSIKDPIERIRRTGLAYVEFGLTNPAQYKFMFMTDHRAVHPEEVGLPKGNPEEDAYAFLQQCVADAINQQRIRPELCEDPNRIANMLWSCVHGVVSLHMIKCHDHYVEWGDPRELAKVMVETVIRGISSDGVME
jgi:AcrR family transcriptional regulator